jgi:D-alanine-D-alanine ligase
VAAALTRLGHKVTLHDIQPHDLAILDKPADLVFIMLHGEFGEDGTVQAELARRGIKFTGCDAACSALAMNKVAAKERFAAAGVPTPEFRHVFPNDVEAAVSGFSLPAVVKPVASGSSVDTYICKDRTSLADSLKKVVDRYGSALLEAFIPGLELTVGVLGDRALPVCEIRTKREFYNYEAKYLDDDTQYLFDLDIPADVLARVQELSVRAFQSLGCRDFSRVDWRMDPKGWQPFALEVNTIPGFTSHSLLPKSAERVGLSYDQLCQRIVDLALVR